jgi:soluble lytic murein transglycosylase
MKRFLLLILVLSFPFHTVQAGAKERKLYLEAAKAAKKSDQARFVKVKTQLKGYILTPYVEYQWLRHHLTLSNKKSIDRFLDRYKNLPISEYLLRKWLEYLDKKNRHDLIASYSPPLQEVTSRCQVLAAQIKKGVDVQYLPNKSLWIYGDSRPDACDPVFKYWKKQGYIGPNAYGQRTIAAIEKGKLKFAAVLARKSTPDMQKLVAEHKRKKKLIRRAKSYGKGVYVGLGNLPARVVDDEVRGWRARQLLQIENWKSLAKEIETMPPSQKNKDQWQYWLARSYAQTGKMDKARKLYRELAKQTSYYGFLSADRLGKPYSICPENVTVSTKQVYKKYPALRRAFELNKVGSTYFAGREWNAAIAAMHGNKEEIVAATKLASKHDWHFRAIYELGKIKTYRHYDIRFPVIWKKTVKRYAKKRGLLPQFIYGIMRTESAMRANVQSHAGAMGIMQVMPATARRVAKKYRMRKPGKSNLLDPPYNIAIGSGYLDMMGKRWNDQLILMIASYNAGPHNVKRWIPKLPKTADVFVDTIPYNETRKYVSRVLDYTTLYAWRLGYKVRRLGGMMSNIGSKKGFLRKENSRTSVVCDAG